MNQRDHVLAEISVRQLGLVTRTQLLAWGFSSSGIGRRIVAGELRLLLPGVYVLRGVPPSPAQQLLGACLSLGDGSAASHRSAAWLWGLDGFHRPPWKPEVSVPHGTRRTLEGVELHQLRGGHGEGFVLRLGVPTTVLTRTLLDLASFLGEGPLEVALDSAARGNPEFFHELDEFLSGVKSQGRRGIGTLLQLVRLRRHGEATGSGFETDLFRLLRRHRLPLPLLQYPIFETPERPLTLVDFAYPELRLALYADGNSIHTARRRARLDAYQRMKLVALGWKPIIVMRTMLKDPEWIASFKTFFPPPPQYELPLGAVAQNHRRAH